MHTPLRQFLKAFEYFMFLKAGVYPYELTYGNQCRRVQILHISSTRQAIISGIFPAPLGVRGRLRTCSVTVWNQVQTRMMYECGLYLYVAYRCTQWNVMWNIYSE